jgi:succinyl-CoA synthetase alpha subunit
VKKVIVKKDSYFDSVFLMLMSKELKDLPQVADATVTMGTPMNLDLLAGSGFPKDGLAAAGPNDLVIALDADSGLDAAVAAAEALLVRKTAPRAAGAAANPRDLRGAVGELPGANVAVISLPGAYAAREARKALEAGLHVMLFSDNVSLDDEVALKTFARPKGLLVMGPDCGTALINGFPLCFANVVRRGSVGIVAASGTGLQEVSCLLDRFGAGVSQGIGTGGRDLKNEKVGGLTMLTGIEALAADAATQAIVVVSKPPARPVADKVLAALEAARKPAVVHFIGLKPEAGARTHPLIRWASNLEEAARMGAALALGRPFVPSVLDLDDQALKALVTRETAKMSKRQKFIRGYYTGGTLADEAWLLLHALTGAVWSNNQTDPAFVLADPLKSVGHTVVDLGDDVFTVGRPHPMIDPSTRTDRIEAETNDPEIAVMLVDVVLGYGSHADPAGALIPALVAAKAAAVKRGGYLAVVASITGTEGDYQGLAGQRAKLEAAGVVVMPSNYQAAVLSVKLLEKVVAK